LPALKTTTSSISGIAIRNWPPLPLASYSRYLRYADVSRFKRQAHVSSSNPVVAGEDCRCGFVRENLGMPPGVNVSGLDPMAAVCSSAAEEGTPR
jgi:hypothetical protein